MGNTARRLRDVPQKEFAKLFDTVCQRHNRWTVFSDFVHMAAICISNTVDREHAEEREKAYMRMAGTYDKKELLCFSQMLGEITLGLDADLDQDFLGEVFMALELGNKCRGQFFTPYDISNMMVRMLTSKEGLEAKIKNQGWIGVSDPACGAGGMLVAFANACQSYGINYQSHVLFVGQDIDSTAGYMCYLQMSLMGCPGYVVIADTLSDPATSIDQRGLIPTPTQNLWYTPFYFREEWHYRRQFAMMDRLFSAESGPEMEKKPEAKNPVPALKPKAPGNVWNETKIGQLSFF